MIGYYAIDMTKLGVGHMSADNFAHDLKAKVESMPTYAPRIHLLPMKALWACHGPFEKIEEARLMAASETDESGIDYFKHKWCFIELPIVASEYEKVLMPTKFFVCTDEKCGARQHFKGFCSMCKSRGNEMVKTIVVRDWNGVFEGVA